MIIEENLLAVKMTFVLVITWFQVQLTINLTGGNSGVS